MRNPCMICLIWCIGSVAELSRVCGIHSPSPRHFSCNFLKINVIHVCFLFFLLIGERHLQNGFPIMGHLCCITLWLLDLYTPRGDQASDIDATPPQELSSSFGKSGNQSNFLNSSGSLLGLLPVWSMWWWMSKRAQAPPRGSRRVKSSNCTQWTGTYRNERQRWLVPWKTAMSKEESFNNDR